MQDSYRKGIVRIVLAMALVLAGCATTGSADSGSVPVVSEFITLTEENGIRNLWIPQTSFGANEGMGVATKLYDHEGDIRQFVITFKKNGTALVFWQFNNQAQKQNYTQYFTTAKFAAGAYTAEMYAVDKKGNISNTMTVAFTVQ
jgi:hypothetical protein